VRDLHCFRLLVEKRWDHPDLAELLAGLARRSSRQRAPFLGPLLDLMWSEEPAAKALVALALACMGDADGHLVVEAVVDALGDDGSREAAMRALRGIATRQPPRWIHALFHTNEAVRLLAVAEPPPDDARTFELYALADPTLRARILARTSRTMRAGPEGIGAVLEFAVSKTIDETLARSLLTDTAGVLAWFERSRRRAGPSVTAMSDWRVRPSRFDPDLVLAERDDLDVLLDLFWEDPAGDVMFLALAGEADLTTRAILSVLAVGWRRKKLSTRALTLLFALDPSMISWTFLPEAVRHEAVVETLARAHPLRKTLPAAIQPLLFHPLCLHPDGGADLRVLAALMTVTNTGDAVRQLAQWIGNDNVIAAIEARPQDASALFQLPDSDELYKKDLYYKLSGPASEGMIWAFVRQAPEHTLGFLAHVDAVWLEAALADLVNQELPASRARRLSELAAKRLDGHLLNDLFARWHPRLPASEEDARVQLGFALLFATARVLEPERFIQAVTHIARTLPVVLGVIDENPTFPYGKEVALAHAVRTSPDPFVRRWAELRIRAPEPPPPVALPPTDEALARAIVMCKRSELPKLVESFLQGGRMGLAAALGRRTDNPAPHAMVCAALLASTDPAPYVDAELVRWGEDEDGKLLHAIETILCERIAYKRVRLSLIGHAVLWRFELHGSAFLEHALEAWGDLATVVRGIMGLRWPLSRRVTMQALADAIAVLGARDKDRATKLVGADLVDALIVALGSGLAPWAADALLSVWRFAPRLLPPVEARVQAVLVDADEATRDKLGAWIAMVGVPARPAAPPHPTEADDVTLTRVRASRDAGELGRFCTDPRAFVVQEATLRLIELGEEGRGELARILEDATDDTRTGPIVESVGLWDDGPALERVRAIGRDATRPAPIRFGVAISLLERGDSSPLSWKHVIVECVLAASSLTWFRPEHWTKLTTRLGFDPTELALEITTSSQPHAYLAAVLHLVAHGEGDDALAALRAFLDAGTERMGSLRRNVAYHLHARGDFHAFPLVVEQELEASKGTSTLLVGAAPELVRGTTLSFLAAGNGLAKEASLLFHLAPSGVDFLTKDEAYETILLHCASDPIRQRAALAIRSGLRHLRKLMHVAETFAWGARIGQELLGKLYRVQMTGGKSLGHTFLKETRIHVTPLPILRGDKHGREIVEALILHELGHHMYHRGADGRAAWAEAQKEGIHMLLNLVADEHLERNLRALDSSFGDRLKRLASYAFQHSEREVGVRALLGHLGGHAAGVLTKTHLRVARHPDRVIVENGEVLFAMEGEEMAFARFMRALRMGLGNRHGDPIVEQGLALFDGSFRHKTMPELLEIARKLRDIFGWQVQLCNSIGPHETLEGEPQASEDIIWGEGITQEEVDRMVERVLDPKHRDGPPPPEGSPNRPTINISPKNDFDRITLIERVPYDPATHRDYAQRVARPALVMRRYLEELGLHHVPQPMRLRGSRLDKSRILPLVIRNEPRVLLQRELQTRTDLFIGIVIDCSGSMASRDNMERARQFGMLLAEACAGLTGVDLRVFGFTDKVIYDCGTAQRCSAYALKASGGNNDAAALFHAANVARASRRRAKLLVMISDGLPTECTVAALRELVQTLTRRWYMVCAQVAVQPLAEVCFPHYVVCNDPTVEQTVMRFGQVVMNLVRKTIAK
jgi:hypothetical protein